MSGGNPDEGWTVLRTDDGYDLTRFDGKTGALGTTYKSAAGPEGAVREGLVVGRPATFTHSSEIEVWNPATGRARTLGIVARYPVIAAAGGTRVIWYDQSCSEAMQSCGAQVTDVSTGRTSRSPETRTRSPHRRRRRRETSCSYRCRTKPARDSHRSNSRRCA